VGSSANQKVILAIHGGTGIARSALGDRLEAQYREGLSAALSAGLAAARGGGSSLDMVEAAVRSLEDCPLFNAGRGSVFNREGQIEMDAAVMDGASRRAGAVAVVSRLKNPVSAARAVMEKSRHVLLAGAGAEQFASEQGAELAAPEYFRTDRRWNDLQAWLAKEKQAGHEHGTVGAVALDAQGNLAAATSTGGMIGKLPGRVGDSPLIGAGTYADNRACAVSGTGHGEFFIRFAVAHDITARMRCLGESVEAAALAVIAGEFARAGGEGGVIALDAQGRVAMPYNSPGLYRGFALADGTLKTFLYES
jgi:isoaspartyl peptidase/L-asparaginase-like protein (Ntn-hydrolase superfamily)